MKKLFEILVKIIALILFCFVFVITLVIALVMWRREYLDHIEKIGYDILGL